MTSTEYAMWENPPRDSPWSLTALTKMNISGSLLFWQVSFDGHNSLLLTHGHAQGQLRTDKTEIILNCTGRDYYDQALLEARSRYKSKYQEGYRPAGSNEVRLTKGMKGNVYESKMRINWPVYVQPKLDGIRMLACLREDGSLMMRSYNNRIFPNLQHLESDIKDLLKYLPAGSVLDGELYNHQMTFLEITSAVKTEKSIHPNMAKIFYYIFDVDYNSTKLDVMEKRYATLVGGYTAYRQDRGLDTTEYLYVLQSEIANSDAEVMTYCHKYIEEGYEGVMLKKLANDAAENTQQYKSALYREGKHNNILKYKLFLDEEATVVQVQEAKGTEQGLAMLMVKDVRGNNFLIRMRGSFEQRRQWLERPNLVLGKQVTYRYQELSPYGVPRFPVGIAIRDYE